MHTTITHAFLKSFVLVLMLTSLGAAEWYHGSWKMDADWIAAELAKDDKSDLLKFAKSSTRLIYTFSPGKLALKMGERGNESDAEFKTDEKGYTIIRPLKDGKPTQYPPIAIVQTDGKPYMQVRPMSNPVHEGSIDVPLVSVK